MHHGDTPGHTYFTRASRVQSGAVLPAGPTLSDTLTAIEQLARLEATADADSYSEASSGDLQHYELQIEDIMVVVAANYYPRIEPLDQLKRLSLEDNVGVPRPSGTRRQPSLPSKHS